MRKGAREKSLFGGHKSSQIPLCATQHTVSGEFAQYDLELHELGRKKDGYELCSGFSMILTWTRVANFLPTMSSCILPQAYSRAGRRLVLRPSSWLRPARACWPRNKHPEYQPLLRVSVSRAAHRAYAIGRPQPSGGTYRMNLGNGKEEEKSALEQYGVDLTSRARKGSLDPVIIDDLNSLS